MVMLKEKMMASREDSIKKINEMIKKVSVAMLVTKDTDGKLRSRPMTTQKMEFDGDLWFFVSSDANVVSEIKRDAEVNVAYSEDGRYVSVSGKAAIVTDIAKKQELWHPELKVWFEGKEPESPQVMLIKVSASEADYWETGDGMVGNAIRTVLALITGESGSPIQDGHATFENKENKSTSSTKANAQAENASASKTTSQAEKTTEPKASTQAETASSAKASGAATKAGPTKKTNAEKTSSNVKKTTTTKTSAAKTSGEGKNPDLSKQPNQGKPAARKKETTEPKK
jgi:general stress protein 26